VGEACSGDGVSPEQPIMATGSLAGEDGSVQHTTIAVETLPNVTQVSASAAVSGDAEDDEDEDEDDCPGTTDQIVTSKDAVIQDNTSKDSAPSPAKGPSGVVDGPPEGVIQGSVSADAPRDTKRIKLETPPTAPSGAAVKTELAGTVTVAVKPRGHTQHDISRLVSDSALAALGKIDVKPRAHSHVLVLITNDVGWRSKNNSDRENTSTSTGMNFVVLRVLDSVGFNSAPYENFEGANPKHIVFRDKKSGKELAKPTKMASVEKVSNVASLVCKSWRNHPTAMMKTKWRGAATGVVGNIQPGVPLVGFIYNDKKEATMGPDPDVFDNMGMFSVAIVGLAARSLEQCTAGYGLKIATVQVLEDANIASIFGLLPESSLFYNDKTSIADQTVERLEVKTNVEEFDTDLTFISNLVRSSKEKISEKPLVRVDLKDPVSSRHKHKVHIQSNNKLLELEFCAVGGLEASIYHGKRFRITLPSNMFTIQATGLPWIQMYLQWVLEANAGEILVVHDQWQLDKMAEGGASGGMHCCIVPDETFLASPSSRELVLSTDLQKALKTPTTGNHLPLDLTGNIDNYTAWVVRDNAITSKTYAVILDISQVYTVKPVEDYVDQDGTDATMCDDTAVDDAVVQESPEPGSASVKSHKNVKFNEHTSLICRVYPGMAVDRTVSSAFLLVLDTATNKVDTLLPVGIKAKPTYKNTNTSGMAAAGNILSNPKSLFQ